jgi:hypothetical protein
VVTYFAGQDAFFRQRKAQEHTLPGLCRVARLHEATARAETRDTRLPATIMVEAPVDEERDPDPFKPSALAEQIVRH